MLLVAVFIDWERISSLPFLLADVLGSLWKSFTFPNIHGEVSTRDAGLEARKQGMDLLVSLILCVES